MTRNLAGIQSPDRFVSDDNFSPLCLVKLFLDLRKLVLNNLLGLISVSLGLVLTDAVDEAQVGGPRLINFLVDDVLSFVEVSSSLGVADHNPFDFVVGELLGGYLSGEWAALVDANVLRSNHNVVLNSSLG